MGQKLGTLIGKPNSDDLVALKELTEAGKVTPVINRTYPLAEVPDAIRYLHEGHPRGQRWSSPWRPTTANDSGPESTPLTTASFGKVRPWPGEVAREEASMGDLNFSNVMIGSAERAALAEFYARVLGRPADMQEEGWYTWRVGSASLSVGEVKDQAKERQRVILNFETKDVQGECDRIKGVGGRVIAMPYQLQGCGSAHSPTRTGTTSRSPPRGRRPRAPEVPLLCRSAQHA